MSQESEETLSSLADHVAECQRQFDETAASHEANVAAVKGTQEAVEKARNALELAKMRLLERAGAKVSYWMLGLDLAGAEIEAYRAVQKLQPLEVVTQHIESGGHT